MIRTLTRTLAVVAAVALVTPAFAAPKDDVVKPLKTVVGAIHQGRYKLALKQFAGEEQGKQLTTDDWDKASSAQKKQFIEDFHQLFARIAFPKIASNFEHLGAVNYDEPAIDGKNATVSSTIVIEHPLKKQELKVKYTLTKEGSAWKVVDVAVLGDSMLKGIREDQVKPLIKEGGWKLLLDKMQEKLKEKDIAAVELK